MQARVRRLFGSPCYCDLDELVVTIVTDADERLHITRELLKDFQPERAIYRVLVCVSFVALMAAVVRLIFAEKPHYPSVISAFGSSGAATVFIARVLAMWNQAWTYVTGANTKNPRKRKAGK